MFVALLAKTFQTQCNQRSQTYNERVHLMSVRSQNIRVALCGRQPALVNHSTVCKHPGKRVFVTWATLGDVESDIDYKEHTEAELLEMFGRLDPRYAPAECARLGKYLTDHRMRPKPADHFLDINGT
jgi:hypothetical protein